MARNQSSTILKFVGACAAVIAGGAAFGWLFGNMRDAHPVAQPSPPPTSSTLPSAPAVIPSGIHPHTANGNYTAPGAPHIVIEEERQPVIRRVTQPAPAPDPEATQEAAPIPAKPPAAEIAPTDTTQATPSSSAATPAATPDTNSSSGTPSPAVPTPAGPPTPPADPDFEHVNTPKTAPGTSDPESGQQGGDKTQGDRNVPDSGKVQFRVQTGAYTDESSARSAADTLRSQGYSTSTRSERDGDHLVYKVQVGAYRSKVGANKAAGDLQKKGYPAYISPIGP